MTSIFVIHHRSTLFHSRPTLSFYKTMVWISLSWSVVSQPPDASVLSGKFYPLVRIFRLAFFNSVPSWSHLVSLRRPYVNFAAGSFFSIYLLAFPLCFSFVSVWLSWHLNVDWINSPLRVFITYRIIAVSFEKGLCVPTRSIVGLFDDLPVLVKTLIDRGDWNKNSPERPAILRRWYCTYYNLSIYHLIITCLFKIIIIVKSVSYEFQNNEMELV